MLRRPTLITLSSLFTLCLLLGFSPIAKAGPSKTPLPPHVRIALTQVGATEKGGDNRGPEVEKYLRSVGLGGGYAWCAAFVSWTLREAGAIVPKVRSAMARAFITKDSHKATDVLRGRYKVKVGDLLVFGLGSTSRGHIEEVVEVLGPNKFRTVGGNTTCRSGGGIEAERNGGAVCIKVRSIEPRARLRITHVTEVSYGI
jgi:hypothetical protein